MLLYIFLQILRCISHLELAQLIGTGVKPKNISKDSNAIHSIEAFDPEGHHMFYEHRL